MESKTSWIVKRNVDNGFDYRISFLIILYCDGRIWTYWIYGIRYLDCMDPFGT